MERILVALLATLLLVGAAVVLDGIGARALGQSSPCNPAVQICL